MKDIKNFFKNKSKLIIWAIGLIVLWYIWPTYEHEPKFIKENELVTWDMAEKMVFAILIILGLQRLTSNHLFRDETQDNWSKEVDSKIEAIDNRISSEVEVIKNTKRD